MDELDTLSMRALMQKAKEMGLKRTYLLDKEGIIALIRNPPEMDLLETLLRSELLEKVKKMGFRGYTKKNKKELIELLKNPQDAPPCRARYNGVNRRVILSPADSNKTEDKLVLPTISAASKHFNVNPGKFGMKLKSRNESTRHFIELNGEKFALRFEAYSMKEKCEEEA